MRRVWIPVGVVASLGFACGKGDVPVESVGANQAAISDGDIATWDGDILSRSVVRLLRGPDDEFCTGTLISPRVVIAAAHCFVGINTHSFGDPTCQVHAPNGVSPAQGCGVASFQRVFKSAALDQIPITSVWTNAPDPENNTNQVFRDIAVAILARRATPDTAAQSPYVRPWLEADENDAFWASAPIEYFGWGRYLHIDGCPPDKNIPAPESDWLRFVGFPKLLDTDEPRPNTVIGGGSTGGLVFQALFNDDDAKGLFLPGDSGGPLFIRLPGGPQSEWRVAGVASLYSCNPVTGKIQEIWARTMEAGNVSLIRRVAQNPDGTFIGDDVSTPGCSSPDFSGDPNDRDCDGLLSEPLHPWQQRDNCPDDFNADQLDADGDGFGDVCDSCPGTYVNDFDNGYNSNAEGEAIYYLKRTGHDLRHLTRFSTPSDQFAHELEIQNNFPKDVCDFVPVVAHNPDQETGLALELGSRTYPCPTSGNPTRRCASSDTSLINYSTFAFMPLDIAKAGSQGWRRCVCATPDDLFACEAACPHDPSLFDVSTNREWLNLKTTSLPPSVPGRSIIQGREATNLLGDAPRLRGDNAPSSPPSYTESWIWGSDINIDATAFPSAAGVGESNFNLGGLRGRLWSFRAARGNIRTATDGDAALRNSTYSPLQLDEFGPPRIPTPPNKGGLPGSLPCPLCPQFGSVVNIDRGDPLEAPSVFIYDSGPTQQRFDISSLFSQEALASLAPASARLLAASEPRYMLTGKEISHVVMGAHQSVGALFFSDPLTGRVSVPSLVIGTDTSSLARSASTAAPTSPPDEAKLALSGRLGLLLAGATTFESAPCGRHDDDDDDGDDGDDRRGNDGHCSVRTESFWTFSTHEAFAWRPLPIAGDAPRGTILSVTAGNAVTPSLYVLDELHRRGQRWLRVYELALDGRVTEILRFPRDEDDANVSLATSYDGGLLITGSRNQHHTFRAIDVADHRVRKVTEGRGEGAIAVEARALARVIVWGEATKGESVIPRATPVSSLKTVYRACGHDVLAASKAYNPATWRDASVHLSAPIRVTLPAQVPVSFGNAGNQGLTFEFGVGDRTTHCRYQGGASVEHPDTDADLNNGAHYDFVECDDGTHAGTSIELDHLRVHVDGGDPTQGKTSVAFPLNEVGNGHEGSRFGTLISACR